jgi:hypothetical protein
MSIVYKVQPGDNLSSIAKRFGLPNWQAIYNSPENKMFRAKRPNPNLIIAGDVLMLPDSTSGARSQVIISGVPFIHQENQMACWSAAARMVYGYRRMSTDPLDSVYQAATGITDEQYMDLAKAAGFRTVPPAPMTYGVPYLAGLLTAYGPIWAAGRWNGPLHVIVITGVDDDGTLYFNDPAHFVPETRDMNWFNERVRRDIQVPLMYLPR